MSRYSAIGFIVVLKVKEKGGELSINTEGARGHAKDTLARASLSVD